MEKNVIIEEIGRYEDLPMWSAYDRAKRIYFGDHPLGNSILGTKESIAALKRDQMYEYFERRYAASNITVAAAGNFDWKHLVAVIKERCGGWSTGTVGRKGIREARGSGVFEVVHREKVVQEHVFLISPGPPVSSALRYAADTLALVVGDDSGSRLYWALIDPGLADTADCSFHDYEGTGSFYTSFSCEPDQAQRNLAIVYRVLSAVQQDGITEEELRQAKSKILSRVVRGSERPMGRMQAIGMSWIYLHRYRTVNQELKAYDAVSLKTIGKLQERYPLDRVTTLALGPVDRLRRVRSNGRK
jgi:predicted Zn-dependent peptidase